ncbi:MAG: glycogen synthase [Magnetococcales bacterium]|nr:glycogen synthase [Magnetococcales bacterium]
MKALFLTREYPPNVYGGAGVHVEYLSQELAKLMEVEVRCFGNQNSKNGNLTVRGMDVDPKFFANCDKKLKSPFSSFSNCIQFNAEPIDAQLVHCHTWYSHLGGIFAQKAYGIPLVLTTHSLEPSRPWKREQLGLGYDLSVWVEKTAMESADAIIAVSKGMKEDVIRLFNVNPDRIHVIYNGIDIQEYQFTPATDALVEFGINPSVPYVLFVGRITRQKGIIHLVNAIKHVNPNVQIVLCAGEPDTPEIRAEMEQGVQKAQQNRDNIIWIPQMVPKKKIIQLYSHAAVFCCPSIYEPFGIINLEAMACKTPVVGSAVGGIVEIIQHGKTGFLVEFDQYKQSPFEPVNPEQFSKQLADNINQILNNDQLRKEMGESSRKRVEERFSWASIAREVHALYTKLVQSK